jgi:hypothetical protein
MKSSFQGPWIKLGLFLQISRHARHYRPCQRFFSQLSSKPLDLVIKIELVRCLTLLPVRLNWPKKVDSNAFVKVHAKDVLDYVLLILNSSDAKELQFNHFVPVLTAYLSKNVCGVSQASSS